MTNELKSNNDNNYHNDTVKQDLDFIPDNITNLRSVSEPNGSTQENIQRMIMEKHYNAIDYIELLEWEGRKVVLARQLSEIFSIPHGTILYRLRNNKDKFTYGVDYYKLEGLEANTFFEINREHMLYSWSNSAYIWTKSGVDIMVRFLKDKENIEKQKDIEKLHAYLNEKYFDLPIEKLRKERADYFKPSIETVLEIDSDGMVEAKKLYEFLEPGENRFTEWIRTNIVNNSFVEKNVDYFPLVYTKECNGKVNFIASLKLTANFAKKLSMQGKTERAEQAREYFEKLEQKNLSDPPKTGALKSVRANKTDLTVKEVNMFGDTVIAAQDRNGIIWAGVRWICDGLGLTKDQTRNERKKIQDDLVLSQGVKFHPLGTGNANKDVLCLQLDYIPLWLAKISITPNMKENNPELVDKLVKYQLKAKDVLAAAFLPEKYRVKTPKQHSEQYQTTKDKCYTSSTPIPKVKNKIAKVKKSNNWFYNNNHKIERILDAFGWEHRYLYHIILKTIGKEYDLQAAKRIYKEEVGISVTYAMDLIEYFDELSKAATKILDKMMNGIDSVN